MVSSRQIHREERVESSTQYSLSFSSLARTSVRKQAKWNNLLGLSSLSLDRTTLFSYPLSNPLENCFPRSSPEFICWWWKCLQQLKFFVCCFGKGFPENICCEHHVALAPLLQFHINNCGDPFTENPVEFHSKDFEVSVLDWFAKLWEIEKDEYWGYVTHGGTEGNIHVASLPSENIVNGNIKKVVKVTPPVPRKKLQLAVIEPGLGSGVSSPDYILDNYLKTLTQRDKYHLGFPENICYDHHVALTPLLQFHLNNCGDPLMKNHMDFHSKDFEVTVLDWFAKLWEIEKDEYWGYVTHGGT
ncbi:hypothetical protein RDI58_019728 [Solanum bulbocastanum]|uniref:Uncharacterized protein n=1 Tax=Solanum bulbocastanum TaxID=147425 RepID=A0AAN8Y784_SOLBU